MNNIVRRVKYSECQIIHSLIANNVVILFIIE